MATNNNPFEKYLEASQRQGSNYNDLSQGIEKLRSEYETQRPDVVFKNKTINDYAQDLFIAGVKGTVLVPQVVTGLADIAGYGAEKAAQGYGELAALTGLVDRPQEVNYTGHLGKALAELGLDFKTTQEVLDRNYSDPTLRQKQELKALGEMNLDNGLFSQNNGDVLAAKAAYVLDNPSLAVNTVVESLPLIGLGGVIGNAAKGAVTANLAARSGGTATQALNTANQAINNSVRTRIGLGALGEGAVSAGLLQETSRQHGDTGLTTPDQTMLSLAVGGGVGAFGYLGGRAANKAGVVDVDTALINSDPLRAAYLKNNPVSRLVGGAVREGLEEVPQENLENLGENLNTGRGDGNILYGAADSTVLGFAAGALTGGAVNLPTEAGNAFKDIATGLDKAKETIKDKATLKSYEELSNPDSDKYDPAKAFNLQANNLTSDDEALRTQAQVSVDELTTGLETKIDTAMQRRTELAQVLDARDPTDLSDETKIKYLDLQAEFDVISKSLPTLLSKYEQLVIAKDDLKKNLETVNGTAYSEEQAKQDIAVLSQEPVQQTVINTEQGQVPVQVISEPTVDDTGLETVQVNVTQPDGSVVTQAIPTSDLASVQDTQAQEQAIANVTKHFSKFSPEELEVISKSPYLSEQQRNSLRQLSAVKQRIAASSDIGKVRDHIVNGLTGATPKDSHRGMNTYTELVNTGIRNNDERLITQTLDELGNFAQHHTDKMKVINDVFANVKQGETIRVARSQDGVWGIVGTNVQTPKQNGEYDIHINSNKTSANRPVGLIDAMNQEVSIITDHYNALRGIAESFGDVSTPAAVEPVVVEESTSTPSVKETQTETKEAINAEPQLDTTQAVEAVKQWGYLGELLEDEDVDNVFKQEVEKILKLKADRASKKQPTFVSFNPLLTFDGGIEYFTRLAKNDPNITKLTKAAYKLRDLMGIVQHLSVLNNYHHGDRSINLKEYLNKYPELKSIFTEAKEQNTRNILMSVIGDIQEAKDVLSTEMDKLITLVGLLYIQAAFEKGQQYLVDTNYADLKEVIFPFTLGLLSNKHLGHLQKNRVVGNDSVGIRKLITPTELALLDKVDGIPVGELSKEDFEIVKALVQNAVNGYFNQYEVLEYPRRPEKVYSQIVHNTIVEHLPKEGFALENFTPEEVINGAVPQSFIWDFKKQDSGVPNNDVPSADSNIITAPIQTNETTPNNLEPTGLEDSEIYSKLGTKTKTGNVIIKPIYQKEGVQYAKSINGIFSLRVNGVDTHFGNPFSSVESEIAKGLVRTKSTKESVEKFIEWVLSADSDINPKQHKFIREQLQSGNLKGKPIVYYKELGEPSHATALDYLINTYDWSQQNKNEEVNKPLTRLSKLLNQEVKLDRLDNTILNVWSDMLNKRIESKNISKDVGEKALKDLAVLQEYVKTTTTPVEPTNESTKQAKGITEVVAESGLVHKVPTVLLNKMLSVKFHLEQVLSVESGILKPKEKEYISKLLSVFTQLRPNVLVTFLTDFSKIDKEIAKELPKAVGKSVGGNKIYIDLTNKKSVDVLELLTHEYHHAVTIETLDKTPLNTSYHIELAKVHEAIVKYLEDNPKLSNRARDRLSYALTNPKELLTVGTTEPIAIASLRNIDMGNGKTAYTIIMEQSIAVMKEQYGKNFTTEIEDSLNDLLSRTDRNLTTDEASSTKDSSIPSSEAASRTGNNTGTIDESTELQSDSSTEPTDTEVVNTTGLSVLQGLSKEVIAEERTKPLATINLIKAYFSQKLNKDETKGSNPLVAVNNFMQSLPKAFVDLRAYVSNYLEPSYKITDEQLKQLEQFKTFELGFSKIASNLFRDRYVNKNTAPDAPTQNVILYFRDAKGNLDTNMLTAMAASAFQYLIVNGTKVGNKEEDVRKLLRLDAKAPLPYEVSSALRFVGADVKTVVRELGKSIYKSLGLSVDRQGDVDLQQRVELALGQLALDTLVGSGYLKENLLDSTAITEISNAMIAAGYSTANTLGKVNKLTFVSSNVVFNDKGNLDINDEGKVTFEALKPVNVGTKEEVVLPTVEAINETNEGTVGFLQDLFSTDNGYRMPELLEPTKFVQDSIKGTDAKVSEYQKELLTKAHKQASTMRKNTISVLNKLKGIGDNSKYLRQLINAWYDKESLEKVHTLRQDSVIVAAEDIWNKLETGLQWAKIIAEPNGYAEFYSPQDVAQNNRMHTTATFFNEQANQVHRAMANKKEHNITLNIKSDSIEDLNNILRFFQAVGEGLEDLPLGSSINSQAPGYKFFTTDKVRGDHYVSSLLAYLFSEETKPAIHAMIALIENDTIDTKQQEAISKFVKAGGMGIQSLQSLIAIAEYFKAIKDGKTNIEINTPFSSDGVNDGVASANILMGTATPELLQQVGMFLRQETGVQTESMQDNYMKGIEDYYVSFGNKIREALARLANEKIDAKWAKATLALFTKLQLSKDDMKAIRKIAKTWSVPFNYSAGKAALQRALARDFLENIYDQFESIGGEALDNRRAYAEARAKKDNDSMAALEIAYTELKQKAQTLETNIQNALGYGFLSPSSTKVRQVRGSLYRSLSDIKLPVSRPENLLSFTFNTGSVEIIEVITTSNLDKDGKETSSTQNSFVHTGRDAERIIEKYLMSASTAMFGTAAWEATEAFAGKFIASRDLFTEIQNSTFSLYNQLRNALIDAKIESKKGKTFGGYFTLTIAEMEEIDNKLLEFAPILKTVFSIKATSETDALASGLRLYDNTYTTSLPSKRPDLRQVITRYSTRDGKPATTTTNLGREVLEKGGVKNGATAIQSIDAFVSTTVQAIFGILNAHDAGFFALDKFVKGTILQNETYLEAMTKYHFGLEHAESLLRSYKGLESVVQSLGLKKEYADTLSQLFEQVLLGEEVKDKTENVLLDDIGIAILSGGIVGALNDMLLLEGKETFNSNGKDIEEVLEVLIKTLIAKDISKLNQLKNLHSVHHFSGEGGQVLVTEEHIKEMDKQIELLKAKEKELLASITKEADNIAVTDEDITTFLNNRKDTDIKYRDFKPYLKDNSKPEHKAVLGLIEELIPTGLKIRYQEQDIATEGYGNYDEKTNTITITAIADSKVSTALVIHELLHSALAQRINTLQEAKKTGNTKGLEKAIEALDRVEALRETIIGKDGLEYLELKKKVFELASGTDLKSFESEAFAKQVALFEEKKTLESEKERLNNEYTDTLASVKTSKGSAKQKAQQKLDNIKQQQANLKEAFQSLNQRITASLEITQPISKFRALRRKLQEEQKESVITQPEYTVVTNGVDESGNAITQKVTRLSIINKFENIHEFISYGLTDKKVQTVMANLNIPKNTKFRTVLNNLSVGFRKALYAFLDIMGLERNAAKIIVPFYTEVTKLIDEIVQANVQPTRSDQLHRSTTDYNDSVNEMDSLTVMQGLPHSNSEFSQHLNTIITDNIGQLYRADDTARQRINEIQSLQASEARNAGFSLPAKEAIVQQALQLAVETYMRTNAGNLNISQLFKVFKEAKAKMNEESFHNGDWNTATALERSIAKKKYDFIFDTTKKGFEARFISMALASEEVHNLLGFNTISPKPSKEKSWFDTVNSWLKYAISWLADKYVKLNPSNPVHKQINQLVDNLVKLDIRSRQETVALYEHAWNLIGKATTPLNTLAKAGKDKLAANNFLLNSKYLPLRTVGAIAALDAKAISQNIPKAITSMRNELRPNERLGEAMSAMLEASAATGMRKVMDVLIRQGNQNAHERQNISDGTKKSILSWFKEPNKLTKRQHLATTNVILRADLQALTGKFELEEVMDLIADDATLNNEIKVLEQTIAKETNGNGMLIASKLLAKYMVTGIGGDGLVKNARAISVGLGTHYQQTDVTAINEALVENIDLLVSMYALKYSYQGDKDIVTSLYKKEPEALLGILNLHYGLVEQAKTLFKDNPLNFNKGWLPDIANPYKGIKYAESKEEVETLQSLGWQLITPTGLKKDPLDTTETKYMMVHNDMAYQRIVSGAVDLGNPSRKGSEVASKWNGLLSPIVKARNASSQKLSKIPYDKFDPFKQEGGLIAAYDTEGYVIGYSYEMEGSTRNSLLERNNNFADLLGAYAGANFYKPVKEYQSKKVADVLFQDYKDNFKKNPNAYLKLSKDSKDPRVAEMWRMLPHDFKQRAIELYGKGEPIVIRNEAFLLAFGFKKYTVADIFNKLAKDRNSAEKAFVIFANGLLGNAVANQFSGTVADKTVRFEKAIQDIMRVVKDFVVIRSISVLWNNVLSNLFMLMAQGINPITAMKNWSFAVANVRAYQTQNAELIQLRNDLLAGKDIRATEQRIGVLEAQLKRNPITKYIEAGLLSSIVEDVTIQDADYTYTSQFKQRVDNATGWIPDAVKTAGNWLILSPSTQGYQFLATTTQLSDFVAKYTLAEHLQKNGIKFDEAVLEASQTFINYDVPTSMGMQYANDIGLFMFTKFFLRIQAVLYKLLDKRMASVIGQQIAVDQFTNFQGVLDPLAVFHIGNSPFEASVFNAPSAVFDVGVF